MVIGSPNRMMAIRVSGHDRARRRLVDVPHMITGLTDVALRPGEFVRDQRSARVALRALGGRERVARLDVGAVNASAPRGSMASRHGQ